MFKQLNHNSTNNKHKINQNEIKKTDLKFEMNNSEDISILQVWRQFSSEETNYSLRSEINTKIKYEYMSSDKNNIILKKIRTIPVL